MNISYLTAHRTNYFSPDTHGLYCVGNKNLCSHFEDDGAIRIAWGDDPENQDFDLVEKLYLIPSKTQVKNAVIPPYVRKLKNLHFLAIPFPYIFSLTKEALPEKLKSLMISNMHDYEKLLKNKKIKWPNIELPQLNALIFLGDYEPSTIWFQLDIANNHVPNLSYLKTFIDKDGAVLNGIKNFNSLKFLEIEMVYHHNIFDYINSDLIGLDIAGADNKFPVTNLNKLKALEFIRLRSVKAEIDCEVFLSLPQLKEIEILNSKKINNVNSLLKIKNLKSFAMINCGNPLKKKGKEKFKSSGFERLDIDFS